MKQQAHARRLQRSAGTISLIVLAVTAAEYSLSATAIANVVIHDSTWMTDEQSYNAAINSYIAAPVPGAPVIWDHNAAANFMVGGGAHNITSISGDFITNGNGWGGEGVLVEIFADAGGSPSDPTAQFFATEGNGLSVGSFTDTVWGWVGLRLNVDLSGSGIVLDEGSWWLSLVPVHENMPSQPYNWVRQLNLQNGSELHIRKGSEAHGNNHGGTWGTFDWTPISQQLVQEPGDTAFSVIGTIVPTPGALAMLAMASLGIGTLRRSRAF